MRISDWSSDVCASDLMGVPKAPRRRPMIQSVKVKNLSLSKDNVRKSNREADLASLAADIAAHGLLQNLVVTPLKKAGHFTVKAGGRRLRELPLLLDPSDLPTDHAVHVLCLNDDQHRQRVVEGNRV